MLLMAYNFSMLFTQVEFAVKALKVSKRKQTVVRCFP